MSPRCGRFRGIAVRGGGDHAHADAFGEKRLMTAARMGGAFVNYNPAHVSGSRRSSAFYDQLSRFFVLQSTKYDLKL